ncbi:3,2-trans-enoyl-CoA isomerase [Biscogniauxia mediterranea]|nr:3,2-trans-enoyl-CoA isomerase [Biscogniauxia mediterranea]
MGDNVINVEYDGRVATVTIDNEKKLNALDMDGYYALAKALHDIAQRDDIYITVLTGKGRYFSAGADVSSIGKRQQQQQQQGNAAAAAAAAAASASEPGEADPYRALLRTFVANNLFVTRAFARHPKILVAALNGPVVGLTAALVAHADFVYAAPHAFLLTPFSALGLVAEGGASRALVSRLGPARAHEALLQGRRIPCDELVAAGFVNRVFSCCGSGSDGAGADPGEGDSSDAFLARVMREVRERLGDHVNGDSLLGIKALVRAPELDLLDRQNVAEVFAGLDRFASGVPQEEFLKIATGKKKHKL